MQLKRDPTFPHSTVKSTSSLSHLQKNDGNPLCELEYVNIMHGKFFIQSGTVLFVGICKNFAIFVME